MKIRTLRRRPPTKERHITSARLRVKRSLRKTRPLAQVGKRPAKGIAVVVRSPLPMSIDLLKFSFDEIVVQRVDGKKYKARITSQEWA